MSQAVLPERPVGSVSTGLDLVLTDCPLCGADEGEPVAVGQDFAHSVSQDSFLVLVCGGCGLVYLNPRPAASDRSRLYPAGYFVPAPRSWQADPGPSRTAVRALLDGCGAIRSDARVLEVGYGPGLHTELVRRVGPSSWVMDVATPHASLARAAEAAGCRAYGSVSEALQVGSTRYDVILLVWALEHCGAPVEEMTVLRRLLRPGGRLLVIAANAESWAWRQFHGRHWAGYDLPRHACVYSPRTLTRLAEVSGFAVDRLGTSNHPGLWGRSAENLLTDWAAPAGLTRMVARSMALLSPAIALAARLRRAEGAGAQLEAILRKPMEAEV
jgi:SAM-dependent methyltransferase